jgi:hypothetical protein
LPLKLPSSDTQNLTFSVIPRGFKTVSYAAMFNSPLNWADGMGDNPGSPGAQGSGEMAQDTTPRTIWNFLTIPKLQYTDADREWDNVASDGNPYALKQMGNVAINIWNGGVGLLHGVTHPKQSVSNIKQGVKGTSDYFNNNSWSQMGADFWEFKDKHPDEVLTPFFSAGFGGMMKMPKFITARSRYVNLATPARTRHILGGDVTGGGHAWFASLKSL